jgi:hypothetical protein
VVTSSPPVPFAPGTSHVLDTNPVLAMTYVRAGPDLTLLRSSGHQHAVLEFRPERLPRSGAQPRNHTLFLARLRMKRVSRARSRGAPDWMGFWAVSNAVGLYSGTRQLSVPCTISGYDGTSSGGVTVSIAPSQSGWFHRLETAISCLPQRSFFRTFITGHVNDVTISLAGAGDSVHRM